MNCGHCGAELQKGEVFRHGGRDMCEDCYMEAVSVPKTCDPMAVRSARLTREKGGQDGAEGLLPIQKSIFEYIKEKGDVSREELMSHFNMSPRDLEKHFAVLRHCELCRMTKTEGEIRATIF